jgi:hypothetical protein
MGSPKRFGYEWSKYSKVIPEYEMQFLRWVYPLTKEDFKGKEVLECRLWYRKEFILAFGLWCKKSCCF